MATVEGQRAERIWRCPHCSGRLRSDALEWRCLDCGAQYPVVGRLPILVAQPAAYLRSEFAALTRASRNARQRREFLDKLGHDAGLTHVSLDRHRDVLDSEIARAETFLGLLEPAAKALASLPADIGETLAARRSGWTLDSLFPYLLRDWTSTRELRDASAIIGTALRHAFPDPSGKAIAFAGCGAGGFLEEISPDFESIIGFDLTLPVLAAARHLLDGDRIELAMPRSMSQAGRISLQKRNPSVTGSHIQLVAMDAFDTAFADASIDCLITSFLIDLIPDPNRLADEVHRVLSADGVWINYGPSGPLQSLWRFDQAEGASFFESAGFSIVHTEAHRATYLDLSRDCPSWSFQNHMCYLTSARKAKHPDGSPVTMKPIAADLADIVPQHFPGANLIQRQSLGSERTRKMLFRYERIPGRAESFEIGNDAARIMSLVDGNRTVREIAGLIKDAEPSQLEDETLRVIARYLSQGLLRQREQDS